MKGWGPELVKRRPDITMEPVGKFLTRMYRQGVAELNKQRAVLCQSFDDSPRLALFLDRDLLAFRLPDAVALGRALIGGPQIFVDAD